MFIQQILINILPLWFFVPFVTLVFVMLALFFDWSLHRYFPRFLIHTIHRASPVYAALTTSNAILIGFTIIVLWQTLITAKGAVAEETDELSKILVYARALPAAEERQIAAPIKEYAEAVINREWPAMRWGRYSRQADQLVDKILITLTNNVPKQEEDRLFFREILNSFDNAFNARLTRLSKVESIIPKALFILILLNSIILIFMICLISDNNRSRHYLLLVMSCIVVGINMGLIMEFDLPFAGDIKVSNEPFLEVVKQAEEILNRTKS